MHAYTSPNSKVGEVLVITLLTNANLGETNHQAAKIQLINAAKEESLRIPTPARRGQSATSSARTARTSGK